MKPDIPSIVAQVAAAYPSFGGGKVTMGNPISAALKDKPPVFAAGVDINQVVRFVLAVSKAPKKPKGALYCFRDVTPAIGGRDSDDMTEGYMVRDQTNRILLLSDGAWGGRNAAHAYGRKTLKMPPNDGETIHDVDCRPGITWADIRATDGMTHDELMAKLT